ncbi:MAG TPA: branched-chain amino acid ABC transporter permease [Actinomycetota bacterium]|nr:branched-chain amino acid ABC transporter permease [Actinomycetota bacterium]
MVHASAGGPLLLAAGGTLLPQTLNGIFTGSIYALFAVGYTLVFGVLDILNLAHSAVFMLGAVLTYAFAVTFGLPFFAGAALAVAACALVGLGIDYVALRPLRRRSAPPLSALLTTIGLALIFVNLAEVRFGANSRAYPASAPFQGSVHLGSIVVDDAKVATLALSLALAVLLAAFLKQSRLGRAIRAVAENPRAAQLMGINVDAVIAWTLVISSALGAIAGILYGLSQHDISPFVGRDQIELKGLVVMVLGGMGSVRGAVVAGFLLGLAEVAALVLLGSNVSTGVAYALLFVALVAFPGGILSGRRVARQV